jgi:predicted ABC-type transport system involved in lysophospholipase L1 biosynthesis ATPase subunit
MLDIASPRSDRLAFQPTLPAAPNRARLVLQLEGLSVRGHRFSLSLREGEIALVEGGSRAERLRLLGIAAGLSHGGPGRCRLQGQDSQQGSPEQRRALRQQVVGRLLSVDTLPDGVSLRGAVSLPLLMAGQPPHQAFDRANALLDALGVGDVANRRNEGLSRRERRLGLLARALANSPPLLVLEDVDEALTAPDWPRVRAALRVVTGVEGSAVLFSGAEPRLTALADQRVNMD